MRPAAFVARVAAAGLGAAAAALLLERRRPARSAGLAVAAVVAVLAAWYWRPFTLGALVPELVPDHFVPLRAFIGLFSLYTVADVAVDFLLFFPLGVWLAVRPLATRGPLRGPLRGTLPALWLVAVLESGQLWIAGRTFDVTDVLIGWAGVLVGWAVVRQARGRARQVRGHLAWRAAGRSARGPAGRATA
jgi:hypothetical protein